jgi:hypothetical protein
MHVPDSRSPSDGERFDMRPLLALNAALLVVLAAVTFGSSAADAQARPRGEYTMVAGGVNGSQSSAVYIIDERNQELVAVTFDPSKKALQGITYRNLTEDAAVIARRGVGN